MSNARCESARIAESLDGEGSAPFARWPDLFRDYVLRRVVLDSNQVGQLAQNLAPLHQDIVISSRSVGTTALSLDDGPPLSEAAPYHFTFDTRARFFQNSGSLTGSESG
ncbi:MAG: hypothetical protein DMF11_13650 [Verrucomicrobia bacterium]|nr:MAG: hypothetical protein DMF11_13650 [Verrucomicrobiota bacterium]